MLRFTGDPKPRTAVFHGVEIGNPARHAAMKRSDGDVVRSVATSSIANGFECSIIYNNLGPQKKYTLV